MTLPSVARISHLTQFLLQPSLSQGLSASLFIKYSGLEASIVFKISAEIQAVLLFSKKIMFYYLACSCRMRSNDFQPFLQTHCCINIFLHTWIYPGCQRFFAARFVTCRPKAGLCRPRPTNERRSREKTSGEERFDLLFSLNFDHSYRITFKPITANISYCDHMHQHVKIRQI